jgi:Na+/H+ antiporter NhaC
MVSGDPVVGTDVKDETGAKIVHKLEFRMGAFGATVPMLFFIVWAIAISTLFFDVSTEQGLVLGAVLGLALGLFLCKSSWHDYAQAVFDGMAQPVGVVAIIAWFWAGMFAEVLKTGGLVDGLVWLGITIEVHGSYFTAATFLLSGVFATAVGTGYGTTVAFCTLMYPAGVLLGADPIVLFAAILSGAAFGDNLAPVSDTTIVSAVTQGADVPGVVRSRFKYAICAAVPALILFLIVGGAESTATTDTLAEALPAVEPNGLILLVPFALVIFLALSGRHLVTSLTWGILLAIAFIPIFNLGSLQDVLHFNSAEGTVEGALYSGVIGYVPMAVLILLIVAAGYLLQVGGTMTAIHIWVSSFVRGIVRRAELMIWSVVCLLNVFITINTAAEIAAAPFVREIGKEAKLHPYRRANFLDANTSALGYIFPWGGAVLLGVATVNSLTETFPFLQPIDATQSVFYVFHGWFLVLVMLIAAITGFGRRFEGPNGEELKEPPQ